MTSRNVAPAKCRRRIFSGAKLLRRAVLAPVLVFCAASAAAAQRPIDINFFRYWRPGNLTQVELFSSVPLSLLEFQTNPRSADALAVIRRTLEVRDSAKLTIFRRTWQDSIRIPAMSNASLARSDASQHFTFALAPGQYEVALDIADIATGRNWQVAKPIEAFSTVPRHSDLVLAGDLLSVTDDAPVPQAIIRGKLAIIPNFSGALTAEKARIALYTEVYRPEMPAESAEVRVSVTGKNSEFRYTTPAQRRVYPTGIGSEAFALNLTGLPHGEYTLSLVISGARDSMRMEHAISMLPPGSGNIALAQDNLFAGWTEAQMDSVFGPMRYIATQNEVATYEGMTGTTPKQQFLTNFWRRRANPPKETASALIQDFLERLTFVNRDFEPTRRGQGHRKGWQTDRGRIYLKFGPPAERLRSSQTREGLFKACEAWQYTVGRGDRYIFFDRTGFGDFDLVFSTDREEPGTPEYARFFQDFQRFRCAADAAQ